MIKKPGSYRRTQSDSSPVEDEPFSVPSDDARDETRGDAARPVRGTARSAARVMGARECLEQIQRAAGYNPKGSGDYQASRAVSDRNADSGETSHSGKTSHSDTTPNSDKTPNSFKRAVRGTSTRFRANMGRAVDFVRRVDNVDYDDDPYHGDNSHHGGSYYEDDYDYAPRRSRTPMPSQLRGNHGVSDLRLVGSRSASSRSTARNTSAFGASDRGSRTNSSAWGASDRGSRMTDDYSGAHGGAYYTDRDRVDSREATHAGRSRSARSEHAHPAPEVYVGKSRTSGGRHSFSLPFIGGIGGSHGSYGARGGLSMAGASPLTRILAYATPVIILILLIMLMVFIVTSVQSCTAPKEEPQPEAPQPRTLAYQPSISAIDSISDPGKSIAGFTLAATDQNYLPSLSDDAQASIRAALDPLENAGEHKVGFCMLDLQTGSGYAYNLDASVYGASSFKGPVLIYGCQEALEPGILSISTVDDNASYAIISSDNKAYYRMRSLFEDYSETSLATWLANMNINTSVESDTSFPHYTARDSAKLWMDAYLYFNDPASTKEIVDWAKNLFSQTEVSMLRAGVDPSFDLVTDGSEESDENGGAAAALSAEHSASDPQVVVYDKAGWLNGHTDKGLCDAGIVIEGDKAYLITVMTGAGDSDDNRNNVKDLVSALWAQRSTLAPPEGYVLAQPSTNESGNDNADGGSDNANNGDGNNNDANNNNDGNNNGDGNNNA